MAILSRRTLLSALFSLSFLAICVGRVNATSKPKTELLTIREAELAQCTVVQQLSQLKRDTEGDESPVMRQVFAWLFPFGPGWNSVLGTFYISSVPNFILAFIPAQINRDTLNTMTAFATGGLLSDVFLHLVPHAFMGEHQDGSVHFVMVEEKRNILIGLAIFVGFAAFFIMEKTLRVLGGEEGHSHSHHEHDEKENGSVADSGSSSGVAKGNAEGLRARTTGQDDKAAKHEHEHEEESGSSPSKLSAYLNLFGDFVHNIMAASFYSSPLIGATTTLACFAHEIPHEIADYSILIRSGFTKRQAMQSQFLTAVGAFVSSRFCIETFMGIAIHNLSASTNAEDESLDLAAGVRQDAAGILGTTVQAADLVIPFVAGGFLYIGAVAVLPTLLAESKSGKQALREFGAMAFGVLCMFLVAWNE
ncbi:ZIP-like iron-zinc transporter [Dentipellis sp. KUC8613]|nr:ZIP-like iron-zinc transporter [Dentipellis sp. KUC8613]